MTTEGKLRWATNFFIWSAIIALVLEAFPVFDRWSSHHVPQTSSLDATVQFIGYMVGGLVASGGLYIIMLINGLVLHRHKSRIAAALFALLGLSGFSLGVFVLITGGIVPIAIGLIVFFGAYLAIAVWTFVALKRLYGNQWSHSAFIGRVASLLQRPDRLEAKKRTEAYYSLIAKAVSQLPLNNAASREKVYERGRAVLAQRSANEDLKREQRALEEAIRRVERTEPKMTLGNPLAQSSTISLVVSLFFPRLWLIDVTCMSLYWVARIRV